MQDINSILKLDSLVFDKIVFERQGFQNEKEIELKIRTSVFQRQNADSYKVNLTLNGNKPEEYTFEISLVGYFTLEDDPEISQDIKKDLISKNAIAILMPYIRSEVSLLTAQPGMKCVVLPAFNINKMLEA